MILRGKQDEAHGVVVGNEGCMIISEDGLCADAQLGRTTDWGMKLG